MTCVSTVGLCLPKGASLFLLFDVPFLTLFVGAGECEALVCWHAGPAGWVIPWSLEVPWHCRETSKTVYCEDCKQAQLPESDLTGCKLYYWECQGGWGPFLEEGPRHDAGEVCPR
jgi:hypothetical protein